MKTPFEGIAPTRPVLTGSSGCIIRLEVRVHIGRLARTDLDEGNGMSQCTGRQLHWIMLRFSALSGQRSLGLSHCLWKSEEICGVSWGLCWARCMSKMAGEQLELVKQEGQWSQLQVVPTQSWASGEAPSLPLPPTSKAQGHCDEYDESQREDKELTFVFSTQCTPQWGKEAKRSQLRRFAGKSNELCLIWSTGSSGKQGGQTKGKWHVLPLEILCMQAWAGGEEGRKKNFLFKVSFLSQLKIKVESTVSV